MRHFEVATLEAVTPRAPAHRPGEALVDVILQLHARDMAQHDGGDVRRWGRIRVAAAGVRPQRALERGLVEVADVLSRLGVEREGPAHHDGGRRLAFAVVAGGHAEQLPQRDVRAARVVERERLGQELLGEHLRVEAGGNLVAKFLEHDAAGDACVSLAGRGHVGVCVAARATEIFLEDEVAAPHDEQAAVGRAALADLVGAFQPRQVHAGLFADFLRVLQGPPAPGAVRRREVVGGGQC